MTPTPSARPSRPPEQRAIRDALMPYALGTAVKRYLKQTPEYEQARRERRSREWLEREALSLGYLLAETVQLRLLDLDA